MKKICKKILISVIVVIFMHGTISMAKETVAEEIVKEDTVTTNTISKDITTRDTIDEGIANTQSEIARRLEQWYKTGSLYEASCVATKEEYQESMNQMTDQELYQFMLLIRHDVIRAEKKNVLKIEQVELYLKVVEELNDRKGREGSIIDIEAMESAVYSIVSYEIEEKDKVEISNYDEYKHYLEKNSNPKEISIMKQLELICNVNRDELLQAKQELQLYLFPGEKNKVKIDNEEINEEEINTPPNVNSAGEEDKGALEREVGYQDIGLSLDLQVSTSLKNQEIVKPSIMPRILAKTNMATHMSNKSSVNIRKGYHLELCGQLCVTETCKGNTYMQNVGQWYETCGVCDRNGYGGNEWFYITMALDEYYQCSHLGNVLIGFYRYGNCTKWGGSATLDTRKYTFSHINSYCPQHEMANTYVVEYQANGGQGTMPKSSYKYDQKEVLRKNGFTKEGARFLGWSTSPEAKTPMYIDEEKIQNLTDVHNETISLYAVWEEVIIISYKGNGAQDGMEKTEEITAKDVINGYNIQKNEDFTLFKKEYHSFAGWGKKISVQSYEDDYIKTISLPMKISFQELCNIAKEQEQTEDNASAARVTLYAVWDKVPELSAQDTLEFYEGEHVTKEQLCSNIIAKDQEDESSGKSLEVKIVKLEYADGKLVDGKSKEGEQMTWADGMPDDYILDTWFLQMDPKQSPVNHKITYEVKDSFGNKKSLEWIINVKYNEFPLVQTEDRYFTLEEAVDGKITNSELLSQITAIDKEDGALLSNLIMTGFSEAELKGFQESGYVVVTTNVKDKYGKETIRQFTIFIVKDGMIEEKPEIKYLRFVNKENYDRNAHVDIKKLTKEEIKRKNKNGGMSVTSKWYTDKVYKELITETLNAGKAKEIWTFHATDVSTIKELMKSGKSLSQIILEFKS